MWHELHEKVPLKIVSWPEIIHQLKILTRPLINQPLIIFHTLVILTHVFKIYQPIKQASFCTFCISDKAVHVQTVSFKINIYFCSLESPSSTNYDKHQYVNPIQIYVVSLTIVFGLSITKSVLGLIVTHSCPI